MKKITFLLLIPLLATSLVGCSTNGDEKLKDTDFDGLYDSIDPNPTNNTYAVKYYDEASKNFSNPVDVTINYKDFIYESNPTFNPNIAQIGASILSETYLAGGSKFTNDVYQPSLEEVFPIFSQFGHTDIGEIDVGFLDNPEDRTGMYVGHHKAIIDGKKYQFFFFTIKGYLNMSEWASNFDVGYDSQDYRDVYGDVSGWTNKKDHKGFAYTANRCYEALKGYIDDNKDNDFEPFVFGCGHSRGGGVTNLIGKKFNDEQKDIKGLYYCFNTPQTTDENDTNKLSSYKNIFNLVCREDPVSNVPLLDWGFKLYGNTLYFSLVEHADYFKQIDNEEYPGAPSKINELIVKFLKNLAPDRKSIYEMTEDADPEEFDTKEEANEFAKDINDRLVDERIKKCVEVVVEEPKDPEDPYVVKINKRPCTFIELLRLITTFIVKGPEGTTVETEEINKIIENYNEILMSYVGNILDIALDIEFGLDDILTAYTKMLKTHGIIGACICAKFAA